MPRKPADLTPKRKNKHFFFVFLNGPQDPPKTSGFWGKPAEIEKTNGSLSVFFLCTERHHQNERFPTRFGLILNINPLRVAILFLILFACVLWDMSHPDLRR